MLFKYINPMDNPVFDNQFKKEIIATFVKTQSWIKTEIINEITYSVLENNDKVLRSNLNVADAIKQFLDDIAGQLTALIPTWAKSSGWKDEKVEGLGELIYPLIRACIDGIIQNKNNTQIVSDIRKNFLTDFFEKQGWPGATCIFFCRDVINPFLDYFNLPCFGIKSIPNETKEDSPAPQL